MEITQEIYGFVPEEEGEAIVIYTMTAASGVSASVTNIGASLVSLRVLGRDGEFREVVEQAAPVVVNRAWEARVEVNRVVFSIIHITDDDIELALEVAYHLSEEGELEMVISAASVASAASADSASSADSAASASGDGSTEIDVVPRTRFNISREDRCFEIEGWRKNILAEAGVVSDPEAGIEMTVLTSLPAICVYGSDGAGKRHAEYHDLPLRPIAPGERQIHKIVYKFSR